MADDNQYKKFVDDAAKELKRLEALQERLEGNIQRYQQRGADKRKKQYKDWEKNLLKVKSEQDEINTALKLEKTERNKMADNSPEVSLRIVNKVLNREYNKQRQTTL
jgi:hypothetical protein